MLCVKSFHFFFRQEADVRSGWINCADDCCRYTVCDVMTWSPQYTGVNRCVHVLSVSDI